MWSDRRGFLTLALAGAVSACGFAPVYGPEGEATPLRGKIRARDPSSALDFTYLRQFEKRLGRPEDPVWEMDYRIALSADNLGITTERDITRYNLIGRVDFTVTDIATGRRVARERVESFTGYSATGTTVSIRSARTDANRRLMIILADRTATRLFAIAPQLTGQ